MAVGAVGMSSFVARLAWASRISIILAVRSVN